MWKSGISRLYFNIHEVISYTTGVLLWTTIHSWLILLGTISKKNIYDSIYIPLISITYFPRPLVLPNWFEGSPYHLNKLFTNQNIEDYLQIQSQPKNFYD